MGAEETPTHYNNVHLRSQVASAHGTTLHRSGVTMRFLLDTNVLIPLEDSQLPLVPSLASFVRLAHRHGHVLLYHPASEDDIREDKNASRRNQTLQRLGQYERLDARPECPWNTGEMRVNDLRDNEILYALTLNAANGLVTEDRGIHDKAKALGIANSVYTIQTANDLLQRLHREVALSLPNVTEVPLFSLTPQLGSAFFDSLREGYPEFNDWFARKAKSGVRAWISKDDDGEIGAICIYARQDRERVTDEMVLPGEALKLSTFKVGDSHRGRKIGELFLKAGVSEFLCSRRLGDLSTAAGVACDERPARWASRSSFYATAFVNRSA
ncbi:MAG: hypothetical protein RLZZ271_887 [Pseudomonadota bacterium]